MDTLELSIRGELHTYTGPSNWNEVSEQQALQICRLIAILTQKQDHSSIFVLFQILFQMPLKHLQWLFDEDYIRRVEPSMPQEDIDQCIEQGKVLLEQVQWTMNSSPSNWIMKSFAIFPKIWYGPANMLGNSTFEEFSFAENYFAKFTEKHADISNLNKLIATLYRRGDKGRFNKTGDYRLPFSPNVVSLNLPIVEKLSPEVKHLVLLNYGGVREQFANAFKNVFSKADSKKKSTGSWLDVTLGLAGDNFTNYNAIKNDNVLVVLKYLDNRIAQQKEIAKAAKK
jgi:hypothetical protein